MYKFREITDAMGRVIKIETAFKGKFLMAIPELNKGSAFTHQERAEFGLMGKLPSHTETLEEQADRYYAQYQKIKEDIDKNKFLNQLKQNNNTAFYFLVMRHLKEMLPIVYTPTIGDAVEQYSFQFDLPKGLHFSYENKGKLHHVMDAISYPEVDLIIVTDGEGVLGIGDWGVGGIDICVGKLMVYTLCGGINPRRVLPIQIDVGTNNPALLKDPMYLGWRHPRITGAEYDAFIDEAVSVICHKYPHIYLHWEDFGRDNARKNLNRYRDQMCTFNDDMQGTGATATACWMSALKATGQRLEDQRVVFFGAGTAGAGIADQMYNAMVQAGISESEARQKFWLIDRPGLLTDDMDDLAFFQKPYARSASELAEWETISDDPITLLDVVRKVKPTILIGCSTVTGAFTQEVITSMAKGVAHPIVFPLSNPTHLAEATPQDIIHWSEGRALVATGSPFDPVEFQGRSIRVSQCNNAFVFPGLGLGVIASQATRVTDGMIAAACHALSDCSPALKDPSAPILPDFDQVHEVSRTIALAVAQQARQEGVTRLSSEVDLSEKIAALFWKPAYIPYEKVDSIAKYNG